jgi:ketosteroid isomerase-like protein
MSQDNVEIVRQAWDAWLRGELPRLFDHFDADVVWDTSHFRNWPEPVYRGRAGVERFLGEWLAVWDEYEMRVDGLVAGPDGRVVSLIHHRGKGRESGLPLDMRMAQVTTIRDGKITRVDNYDDRAEALESVGLRERIR